MASIEVNEDKAYAEPKDIVGKGIEYAQPALDKPPGGRSKLRKQREQQLAMQKGNSYMTLRLSSVSPYAPSIIWVIISSC